ncbi:MAG: hypothetical protein AAFV29_11600 [Myxococcota bacterium]
MITERRICAVRDTIPAYRRGLMRELTVAGYEVAEPEDVLGWIKQFRTAQGAGNCRLAVLHSIREEADIEMLRRIRECECEVHALALLVDDSSEQYARVLNMGATGAVSYGAPPVEIIDTVAAAWVGAARLPQHVVAEFARQVSCDPPLELDDQSIRRLNGLAAGRSIAALAREEHFSKREMHRRLHNLYRRLGVENRYQAIAAAARQGFLSAPETPRPPT